MDKENSKTNQVVTARQSTESSARSQGGKSHNKAKQPQLSPEERKQQQEERRLAREKKNQEYKEKDLFALNYLKGRVVTIKSFIGKVFLLLYRQADFYIGTLAAASGQIGGIPSEVSDPLNEKFRKIMLELDDWNMECSKVLQRHKLIRTEYKRPDDIKRERAQMRAREEEARKAEVAPVVATAPLVNVEEDSTEA